MSTRPRRSAIRYSSLGAAHDLVSAAPSSTCVACVIIPARDEAETLPATLRALHCQTEFDGRPFDPARYEIIVLANNCRDETARAARLVAEAIPALRLHVVELTLPDADANVGAARCLVMDEACRRLLRIERPRAIIASTDADTVVSPIWLAATLAEIAAGADAVGGRIIAPGPGDDGLDAATRAYHLRDVTYRHLVAELESLLDPDAADPWPRHHQHFGASFAVTAETYLRVGGVPAVPVLEDAALYQALRLIDARIRHSPRARVVTSARRSGRVAVGLSTQLGEWEAMARAGRLPTVESAAAAECRVRSRRALREIWHQSRWGGAPGKETAAIIANRLGVDPGWLKMEARRRQPFGVWHDRVLARVRPEVATDPVTEPLTEITRAIADLRGRLAVLRRADAVPILEARYLSPFEDVQPVSLLPPATQGVQQLRPAIAGEEGLMDLVAG